MEQDEEETKKKKKQKKWDRDRDFGFSRRVPRSCATGSASFYRVSAVHLAFFCIFSSSFSPLLFSFFGVPIRFGGPNRGCSLPQRPPSDE